MGRNQATLKITLLALCVRLALGYSSSWEDCEAFAALWSANCGGTNLTAAYDSSSDWETQGIGMQWSSCSTQDSDTYVREPNTGNLVNSFSVFATNCITCRNSTDENDETVFIRYQTNNLPKHCYGTLDEVEYYPAVQKIDIEMQWNPDVLHVENVDSSTIIDVATTESVLCDYQFSESITLPSTSLYTEEGTFDIENVVGFSMDNVVIQNALTVDDEDAVDANLYSFDFCLASMSDTNMIKYHTMTSCLLDQVDTSNAPLMCRDSEDSDCAKQPVTFATANFTRYDLPYETPLGLAKDGHIIVGPYNEDGELWACDEHDICNGVFLSDNSYAYALTYSFPYVVGCWGPGPDQQFPVSCSDRTCSGALSGMQTTMLALVGALVAMASL